MPPTRVPRCGALVVVVAVPAHPVPRLRRGRVPASAPASGVRVVDVPASTEPRLRRRSRARAPRAACSRPASGGRGARAPRAVCSRPECRAADERAALAPALRVPPWCARDEGAAVLSPSERPPCARRPSAAAPVVRARRWPRPRRACRVLVPSVPRLAVAVCPRRACGCARVEGAVLPPRVPRSSSECRVLASRERPWPCLRRVCRAPAPRAAVPASIEPRSRRPSSECRASDERAAVLAHRVPWWCARVDGAVCPRRTSRRRVLASMEPPRLRRECRGPAAVVCPRRACRRARVECAALGRSRRACRRARAQSAAAVCLRRGSRRALDEGAVRWCRGRRVRMVDVPSPSVPH